MDVPITSRAPFSLAICMPISPTPELAPWISTLSPALQPASGDDRVVHGLQRDGSVAACSQLMLLAGIGDDAAPVGDRIFGVAAVARAHHAVARLDGRHLAADRLDLAREFQAEDGARRRRRCHARGPPP